MPSATALLLPPSRPTELRRLPDLVPPSDGRQLSGGALLLLLVGFALSVIDFFIVNVALPTMGRDLHASDGTLELVVSGYGLAYALLLVVGGRLGDAIGRRRLFLGGMAAFTVTSLACGVAPSAAVLIAGRVLQGAAAAMMVPQVMATIQAATDGPRRARAVGMFGATAGLSMVVGQILGGAIVSANLAGSGWRGIFLVNVPIGGVALVLVRRSMPDTRSDRPPQVDLVGTGLLAATLLSLLLPLSEGKALGWPLWSWVLLALVPIGASAFIHHERALEGRGRTPLVPPSIMAHRSMRTGLSMAVPFFISFGGFMFAYAVGSQEGLGFSPLKAGMALAPLALAFFATSLVTARLVARFGVTVTTVGSAVQAAGLLGVAAAVLAGWPHPNPVACLAAFAVMGAGQGLVVSPMLRVILADVPADLAGAGSGVMSTTQQTALALGVAVIGTLFTTLVSSIGYRDAAAAVLGLQFVVIVGVAWRSRQLPQLS